MYSLEISIRLVRPDNTTTAPLRLRLPRWIERLWLNFDPVGAAIWITSPKDYRRACQLYKEQRYSECAAMLAPLTRKSDRYPPALFRQGLAENKLGQFTSAYASISAATKCWPWRRRWLRHLRDIKPFCQLEIHRPQVVLYLSGISGTAYQGNMWIPVMEKLNAKIAIVARERHILEKLIPTSVPIFYMTSMRELEFLEKVGVRTVLYPANTQKNTHMMRFASMNHFFINHGESDKVVNQSKFLMGYDKLLVAGPLAEKRLHDAGIPLRPGQVVHVGRPPVQLLLKRPPHLPSTIRTILYAPTWEGFVEAANYSSVSEFGLTLLKNLISANRWKIVFKPHPLTGTKNPSTKRALREATELCERARVEVAGGDCSIYNLMNEADLMVTDISSTIPDFLFTMKPMVLANVAALPHKEFRKQYPSTCATYILDAPESASSLVSKIDTSDELLPQRKATSHHILGGSPETSVASFNRVITDSLTLQGQTTVTPQ
jgi:hypothetical protein